MRVVRAVAVVAMVVFIGGGAFAKPLGVPAAGSPTVVVPRVVGGGVVGAYGGLRASGLRVSIPQGVSFDSLRPPVVARSVPAAGRRVAPDSVVRLYLSCCGRVSGSRVPAGRVLRFVVPAFRAGVVSTAYGWAARRGLDFRAYLGPLRAGAESGLFANYRISRQRPAAGARIQLGERVRGAVGKPGRFRRSSLVVWGAQPPACTPRPGDVVVARSADAVITSHAHSDPVLPSIAWYGCLRTVGEWRILTSGGDGGYTDALEVRQVRLAGPFVAFSLMDFLAKATGCVDSVAIYDLRTSRPGRVYSGVCPTDNGSDVDSLALDSSGLAAWHTTDYVGTPGVTGMSCPSVSLCVATDTSGNVLTSTNPRGGRQAWSVAPVAGPGNPVLLRPGLGGVSCPAANLCVAVGANSIYTSTDPTGGAASWTVTHVPALLSAVACPSTSLCVATGFQGIETSTNPTGGAGAWATSSIPSVLTRAIDCPSSALCVAGGLSLGIGGTILTSTNPTAGASAWTAARRRLIGAVVSVSCPATDLCVAGSGAGEVMTSSDPADANAWTVVPPTPNTGFVGALSCPSVNLCVAGAYLGSVIVSTNPTGGAKSWTTAQLPIGGEVQAISCPSTTLCVAGDGGYILTATNPAGAPSAWSVTLVDAPPSCTALPCAVEHVDAYDTDGIHVLDTSLPGAGGAITNLQLTGTQLTWTDNGTPHQATLH